MGSFNQMTLFNYRCATQRRAIQRFAHWKGLSQEAAAERWCKGCAEYWREHN